MPLELKRTEPMRQLRPSNNLTARVQCPTRRAEPGWRCSFSNGGAARRELYKARVRGATAAKIAGPIERTRLTTAAAYAIRTRSGT